MASSTKNWVSSIDKEGQKDKEDEDKKDEE
jgi:hypothetical protein